MTTPLVPRAPRAPAVPAHEFRVEAVEVSGSAPVRLIGELDLATVAAAEQTLLRRCQGGRPLTLDLSALTYCDSQGTRMLFNIARALRSQGGTLVLLNPRGIVRRVFDIVNLRDAAEINIEHEALGDRA